MSQPLYEANLQSLPKLGKGKVFYFRPGHETYGVFTQPIPLRIIANAVEWLGGK